MAVVAFAALVSIYVFALRPHDPFNAAQPFSSDKWKQADLSGETRCGMIANLQQKIGIVGKSRPEIERLLGYPEHGDDPVGFTHYHLCPSTTDIYILELRWENNRVVSADVRDT